MVVSVLLKVKFWTRPKQSSSTPLANYPKGESVVYFEKMHVYVYKASYYNKGKMKDSKNF